jgi:hypothetical protein
VSVDPTDPRVLALMFADPAYGEDWRPEGRPDWPGTYRSAPFRAWVAERLAELDDRVREDQRRAIAAALTPEHFARVSDALADPKWAVLTGKLSLVRHQIPESSPDDFFYTLVNGLRRLDERKRRGRTRGEETARGDAQRAAGWDLWKLRKVVLPRFWPMEAVGEYKLASGELARVAADRNGCTTSEAQRYYLDARLAGSEK